MEDIKTQWEKPISTRKLREPLASHVCVIILCHHPTMSLTKLAKKQGIPENTIYKWASKYHYRTRVQAFLQQGHEEIEKQKYEIIMTDNQEYIDRQPRIQKVLDKLLTIAETETDDVIKQIKQEKKITKEQHQTIKTSVETYNGAEKDHAIESQTYLKTTKDNISSDRYNKDEMSPAAKALLEQFERIEKDD